MTDSLTNVVRRVAAFSVHTSPLAQPGLGDGGGMNVYVDSLAASLARAGVQCDVFCRAETADAPLIVEVMPRYRVIFLEAGPRRPLPRSHWPSVIDEYHAAAREFIEREGGYDVLHAHYWMSGAVAHRLKHELDLPLITTFHTLSLVKAAAGFDEDPERERIEADTIRCSDLMLANTHDERDQLIGLYEADPSRIEVVAPGVDHTVFHSAGRSEAKAALGLVGRKTMLFAGRIQPLKGADVAVRVVAGLKDPEVTLLLVGGPSGIDGEREMRRLHALVGELDVAEQVRFIAPQSHDALADYYRAADVCVVPSRTESFGLVALEAASCGTPVVASAVGGLRHVVAPDRSGYLVGCCDAANFIEPVRQILDDPVLASRLQRGALELAATYSWSMTAARLRRLYADLAARELVQCS
jgi:D-inositol-3-phosphate glycosyltransferase